jgi:polar amino acid transport system permease protein
MQEESKNHKRNQINRNRNLNILAYVLVFVSISLFILFVSDSRSRPFQLDLITDRFGPLIFIGFLNTIWVSLVVLLGSMIIGFLFFRMSKSNIPYFGAYLRAFTNVFTEIIYGTPLLVLIVVSAFVIGPAFNIYQRNLAGIISLIIYITPYMKNVYQSAFSSISNDQFMAMDLFGFTSYQRYRYIIIPQVVRILMPPLMNNFSLIIKGSALLNILAFNEIYYTILLANSITFAFVEGYLLMWALYLIITIPLSQLTKYIERKWSL